MTETPQLKAVLLDLDDTLIPEHQPLANAYAAVAAELWGVVSATDEQSASVRQAARAYWTAKAPHPAYQDRIHLGPSDGLSAQFTGGGRELEDLRAFVADFHRHAFDAAVPASYSGDTTRLRDLWWATRIGTQTIFDGAIELLTTLREHYRLALVTNGASDFQRHKLEVTGLRDYFDVVVISGEVGVGKPDPAPFNAALSALDASVDEAVMIGNDKGRDILGADRTGLRSIWVQPGDSTQTGAVTDLREIPGLLAA